ncbi:hypothetical protein QTP70_002222 [Hemibagrus guttatus]|uniref:Uncharacterized protein n=1 Tax=Hemibagrus guttatus TaxID=175788 RepID=A0AAE0QWE9_9TELE|nr:hypothetical protein QTP70_002222 [Hemibagrus guttatus]
MELGNMSGSSLTRPSVQHCTPFIIWDVGWGTFPGLGFGKRSAGSLRRGCECIVLEPSEMIVVDYMDENEEYFQRQASHRQSRRRFRKINQKGERQTIIDTVEPYQAGKPPISRGYHTSHSELIGSDQISRSALSQAGQPQPPSLCPKFSFSQGILVASNRVVYILTTSPWTWDIRDLGYQALGEQGLRGQALGEQGLGGQALGEQGLGDQALGEPGLGYQALGEQGLGDRALGEQGLGGQALGEQGPGDQALGEPGLGYQALGEQGLGDRALGEQGLGDRALGEQGLGDRALGEQGLGDQALGEQGLGDHGRRRSWT